MRENLPAENKGRIAAFHDHELPYAIRDVFLSDGLIGVSEVEALLQRGSQLKVRGGVDKRCADGVDAKLGVESGMERVRFREKFGT